MVDSSSPFANYPLFSADKLDNIQEAMDEHFEETFYVSGQEEELGLQITKVMLTYFDLFGCRSDIEGHTETEPLQAYHFIYVVEGSAQHEGNEVPPGHLVCFNVDERLELSWGGPDCHYVMLRLKEDILQATSQQLYGVSAPGSLTFPRFIALGHGPGLTLDILLKSMILEMADEDSLFSQGITSRQTEELFLVALLHNSDCLSGDSRRFIPQHNASEPLKKAVRFARDNLDAELTLELLVKAAGVSTRRLQAEFSRHFSMGPMSWIKKMRLQQIHHQLQHRTANKDTITQIAARWGFTNPSNFANLYRKEFGELPSETLKRFEKSAKPSPAPND